MLSSQQTATTDEEWVSSAVASRILGGIDLQIVNRLGKRGYISTLRIPGAQARYSRADCERIASHAVKPAWRASSTASEVLASA